MIKNLLKQLSGNGKPQETNLESSMPAAGEMAPAFSLPSTKDIKRTEEPGRLDLESFLGQPSIIVFYPADNSSVCSSQLALYNEALHLIEEHDAELAAISTDSLQSHQEFSDKLGLKFPLLADSVPPGVVAKTFGVLNPDDGLCERAIFVLDSEGRIHWRAVYPRKTNPGMDGILWALESLERERA